MHMVHVNMSRNPARKPRGDNYCAPELGLSGPHALATATWEFPKIRGPDIDPKIVGLALSGYPKKGPSNLYKLQQALTNE